MAQLNLALTPGCLTLRVPAGVSVAEPLRLAFVAASGDVLASPRVLIEIGEGASLTLIETLTSPDGVAHQTNKVVEVIVGKGATFDHVQANLAGDKAQTVTTLAMSIAESATVNSTSFVTSPALVRHQIFARVHGDDAKIALGGVTLIKRQQHVDHTLVVEHDALRGESRETFKTIVDDEARGVFQGKIIVKPHARRPTAAWRRTRCCSAKTPRCMASRSSRSSPTTCNAPMVRRLALWTRTSCSISCRVASPASRRRG